MKWLPPPRLPSWFWPRQARDCFGTSQASSTGMRSRSALPREAPMASAPPRTISWKRASETRSPREPTPRPTRRITPRENALRRSGVACSRVTCERIAAIPQPMS